MTSVQSVPLRVGVKLEEFDEDEGIESCPFRELVGGLMWLAISTCPDMSNAVRSVVRDWSTPKAIHWKALMVSSHAYINGTSGFSITCQRGALEVFTDADYASQATDRIMRTACQIEQSCEEMHMCVGFPGRKNVSPSLHLKQSMLLLATH